MDTKQQGVLRGMLTGATISIALIFVGIKFNPFNYPFNINLETRLKLGLKCCLPLAVVLAVSIGRLAKHRFFTPNDIDSAAGSKQVSNQATILQSIIQNTLEQSLLASITYLAWSVLMPGNLLSVVPLASIAFGIGRLLFIVGYSYGAPSRAVGFTLSFYFTNGMLIYLVFSLVNGIF